MSAFKLQYVYQSRFGVDVPGETDWVCPKGYTIRDARESFRNAFPRAVVGSIIRLSENACNS